MTIPNLYIRCTLTTIIDMLSPTSYLLFPSDCDLVDNTSSLVWVAAIIFDFIVIPRSCPKLERESAKEAEGWVDRGEAGSEGRDRG